jgi:hypothetical protein
MRVADGDASRDNANVGFTLHRDRPVRVAVSLLRGGEPVHRRRREGDLLGGLISSSKPERAVTREVW